MKALRYLTAPNMAVSDRRSHRPGVQNGGPMFLMNPYDHRCCQHNVGQGWPYLAEHLWLATPDDGLACIFPLESTVHARVADGTEVMLTSTTHYPFDPTIEITVAGPNGLPFLFISVFPAGATGRPSPSITRSRRSPWQSPQLSSHRPRVTTGNSVTLVLPMQLRLRTWAKNHGSVSVDRRSTHLLPGHR